MNIYTKQNLYRWRLGTWADDLKAFAGLLGLITLLFLAAIIK